jgi:hypothetical protein
MKKAGAQHKPCKGKIRASDMLQDLKVDSSTDALSQAVGPYVQYSVSISNQIHNDWRMKGTATADSYASESESVPR